MGKWLKTNEKGLIASINGTECVLTDEGNGFYSLNGEDAPPFNLYFDNPPGLYFLDTASDPSESGAYTANLDMGNEVVPFTDVTGSEPYETSGYSYSAEFYDGSIISGYIETYEEDGQTIYDFYSGESASNQVYIDNAVYIEVTEGIIPSIPRIFSVTSTIEEEENTGDIQLRSSANSGSEMLTRIVQQDEELTYYDFIDGDGYYCFNGGTFYNGKYVYKNEEKDVRYAIPSGSGSREYNRTARIIYKGEDISTKYYLVGDVLCKKFGTSNDLDRVSAYTVDNNNVICNYCVISTSENFLTDTYPSVKYNELNKKVIFNPPFPKIEFSGSANETQVLETKTWSELKINMGIYKRYADFIMFEKHNRLDFNLKINGEYPSKRIIETSSNVERIIFELSEGYNESFTVIIDAISKTVVFSYYRAMIQ